MVIGLKRKEQGQWTAATDEGKAAAPIFLNDCDKACGAKPSNMIRHLMGWSVCMWTIQAYCWFLSPFFFVSSTWVQSHAEGVYCLWRVSDVESNSPPLNGLLFHPMFHLIACSSSLLIFYGFFLWQRKRYNTPRKSF